MKRTAIALGAALLSTQAHASGLSAPVIGNSFSSAVGQDPAAVYWNPAMLGPLLRERQADAYAGLSALYLDVTYDRVRRGDYQYRDSLRFRAPVPQDDLDPTRSGPDEEARAAGFIPLPAPQLFYSHRIDDEFSLGLGLFVPFGAVLEFDDGGPQKWALQSVELFAVEAAAAAAWQANDQLSFGVGAGVVGGQLRLRKVVDLASTPLMARAFADPPIGQPNSFGPNAPSTVRELDALSRPVDIGPGYGLSWSGRIGVAYAPIPEVQLGAAYIHRVPLVFTGGFALDMNDPLFTEDLVAQGLRYPAEVNGEAEVEFPLPPSLNLGASWAIDEHWTVALTGSVFFNSVVQDLTATLRSNEFVQPELGLGDSATVALPRDWSDTWQADARVMYTTDDWFAGGVVGYHTPASPDSTLDVSSPDGDRVTVAVQGGLELGKQAWLWGADLGLVADLHVQYVLPRENTGSDYDLANGEYTLLLGAISGGIRARFE
ncbi:MAG: outer membrane protein transport protein [bacterium]